MRRFLVVDSTLMKAMAKLYVLFAAVALILGAACSTMQSARISRAEAERTALARVPNGVVKEGELEKEHGKLIWSFDIAKPGSSDITEIHVDATTGEIIATEKETEAHEKKEKDGK